MDPSETVSTSQAVFLWVRKYHCLRLASCFGLLPDDGQRPVVDHESGELTVVLVIYWLAVGSRQQDAGGWLEVKDAARVIAAADRHGRLFLLSWLLPAVV